MIGSEILKKYKRAPVEKEAREIEVRFGKFKDGRFNSGVTWRQYIGLIEKLKSLEFPEIISEYTDYYQGNVRLRDFGKYKVLQSKESLLQTNIYEYNIRLAVNIERDIPETEHITSSYQRKANRHSFNLEPGLIRLDMTKVVSQRAVGDAVTSYEVELEFTGRDIENLDILDEWTEKIFKLLYDTTLIYTVEEIKKLNSDIVDWIGEKYLVQARNLKLSDLQIGGIVENPCTSYVAAIKADGIRRILVFNRTGIWLVHQPYDYNLVYRFDPESAEITGLYDLSGTIFDGELVPRENRFGDLSEPEMYYFAFDTLAEQGDSNIQNKPYVERLNVANEYLSQIGFDYFQASVKCVYPFETVDNFFSTMDFLFEEMKTLQYKNDGIIFTPADTMYNMRTETTDINNRILTRIPDICKWKPVEEMTIDFEIKRDSNGMIGLYSGGEDRELISLFKGIMTNPFNPEWVLQGQELTRDLPDGAIVEYAWNSEDNYMKAKRIRRDKLYPNAYKVAIDNWKYISDPPTVETMTGNGTKLLRRFHNQIKRDLLNKLDRNSVLLDIGSGRGGDVSKWTEFSHVYAVEPDLENIEELRRRISLAKLEKQVTVINAKGEDYQTIISQMGDVMVDGISFMLSLTFFWESSDKLNGLIELIKRTLKPGGKVVFLTMDGDAVEQFFNPVFGGTRRKEFMANQITMLYDYEQRPRAGSGRELFINIEGTIVENQKEYLVFLTDLETRLNFGLTRSYRADKEPCPLKSRGRDPCLYDCKRYKNLFMSLNERLFSGLFTYGIIERPEEARVIRPPPVTVKVEVQRKPVQATRKVTRPPPPVGSMKKK